jgi:iron complex transport system substrate-binding protein
MIVMPREEASATSYYALGVMAYTVISHISGRDFEHKPD